MRKRAGALYIRENKLLLICEGKQPLYWTPGGGLEGVESFRQALERELMEELTARLISAEPYMTIVDEIADEMVRYFIVSIELPTQTPSDIELHWYSRKDYVSNMPKISERIRHKVYPKLMEDNLV